MTAAVPPRAERRSRATLAAFVVGLPAAALVLGVLHYGPVPEDVRRYVKHPVEAVEVAMFCIALGALGAKLWTGRAERRACQAGVLPPWDGRVVPAADAPALAAGVPAQLRDSWIGRRVAAVLDFVALRGTATDLDDHLRGLAEEDALTLENSYAFTRFLTWAMPILGFLGTVLGITESIAGVTPEKLEHDLSQVTDGLALAFDATALALALTMATMFLSFLVERAEQSVLSQVDRYVERELAHRFERGEGGQADYTAVLRQGADTLLRMAEGLVRRQAELWASALTEADQRRAEAERPRTEQLTAALETALTRTLERHGERVAALEHRATEHGAALAGRLAEVAEAVAGQVEALARLQEQERQLVRLQESLDRNLAVLAGGGAFEQAVESLTAAIHLLTARTAGLPPPHRGTRPGAAA